MRGKLYSSSYLVLENPHNGLLNYANLEISVAGRQRRSSGGGMGESVLESQVISATP